MKPSAKCGFNDGKAPNGDVIPGGAYLTALGPTLFVDIGYDPNHDSTKPGPPPTPGITRVEALVDTGATESCIDEALASQLGLQAINRGVIGGVSGPQDVNLYLAQIFVPSLSITLYGEFAGVHLAVGGQRHQALLGRTFLQRFVMTYNGQTGDVSISA